MNILYLGKYKSRFDHVINHLRRLPPNSRVLELCFGDIYIANYCKKAGHQWRGIDINEGFVKKARGLGYEADYGDLTVIDKFPSADACIIAGSLYHFYPNETFNILAKMFEAADLIVISEPVLNLSSRRGLLGFIARRAASVGKRNENFRYDSSSLLLMLDKYKSRLNFRVISIQSAGKDSIVTLVKNEKC